MKNWMIKVGYTGEPKSQPVLKGSRDGVFRKQRDPDLD